MADHVFHRPGPLRQTNKTHKTGRHRSKGAIDNAQKGKVALKAVSHKNKHLQRKEHRRHQMIQLRKNKREEALAIKRQLGTASAAPFLVCLLPMHSQIDAQSALAILTGCDEEAVVERSLASVTYMNLPRFKQRFAFIVPPVGRGNEVAVLDCLKVCDTTVLLTSAAMGEDEVFDKWGHRIFNMISAQGIPTPIVTLMDLESINPKRRSSAKAAAQKFIAKLLPDERIMQLDTNAEGLNMMRRIGGQKHNVLYNKSNRPHIYGDKVQFVPDASAGDEFGTLQVTGFLRGVPLDVNGLVHIPGLGDYQMSQIDGPEDPYKFANTRTTDTATAMATATATATATAGTKILATADPAKQASLQSENIPDPMDAEQTWPTEEEIEQAQLETKRTKLIKRIPKGWSEYQAAWIPDVETVDADADAAAVGASKPKDDDAMDADDDDEDEDDDDDDDDEDDNDRDDDDFMSCEDKSFSDECDRPDSETEEYVETASVSDAAVNDEKYDLEMDLHEERETMKKIKEARVDEMWPDEIDTPLDVPARERFQKFRGLESFRTSPWDVKENLPSDYARIYQFQNFDRTKRRIINEAKEATSAVQPGTYLTVHIVNVPCDKWRSFNSARQPDSGLVVYGMLPHEHQMSVMNCVLKRLPDSEVPLKSKERLIVQCGYRRFVVNPIFSQHTNGDKHKFERYFRPHTTVCATFYAPIQFPPAPVLAFKENPDSTLALVARGCVLSCNPDRIILKRVVLSGHPIRINRKSASIRYMFFNKADVDYFKPIKLRTKCGRLGHIKETLGTHGHMKCYFDGQLRSYDTVFMYLFKRVFPKWTYEECLIRCEDDAATGTATGIAIATDAKPDAMME